MTQLSTSPQPNVILNEGRKPEVKDLAFVFAVDVVLLIFLTLKMQPSHNRKVQRQEPKSKAKSTPNTRSFAPAALRMTTMYTLKFDNASAVSYLAASLIFL